MLRERRAALLDRPHDRGEVVVEQDEVGRFACDVGAGPSHRDSDVGLVQRRAVVDTVAGHRHDVAALPQGRSDAQLVFGRHAGDDHAVAVDERSEHLLVIGELGSHEHGCTFDRQPDLAGDRQRGGGVVAGDHGDADAGAPTGGDRGAGGGSRRVLEGEDGDELEVALDVGGRIRVDLVSPAVRAGRLRACAIRLRRIVRRRLPPRGCCWRTTGRTESGAPLTDSWRPCSDRHASSVRVERISPVGDGSVRDFAASGDDVDRGLHRVSDRRPSAVVTSVDPPVRAAPRHRRDRLEGVGRCRSRCRSARSGRSRWRRAPRSRAAGVQTVTIDISLHVSVPVLSVQMNVVEPSVSTASRRRTSAWLCAIRLAPIASDNVTVGSRPSGTSATVTPDSEQEAVRGRHADQQRHRHEADADADRDRCDHPYQSIQLGGQRRIPPRWSL